MVGDLDKQVNDRLNAIEKTLEHLMSKLAVNSTPRKKKRKTSGEPGRPIKKKTKINLDIVKATKDLEGSVQTKKPSKPTPIVKKTSPRSAPKGAKKPKPAQIKKPKKR